MEKELNNKKECKDCNYYLQHYIKRKNRFDVTFYGHCINRKPNDHYRKTDKICECYEERDLIKEKEERLKSAKESLSVIAESLNQLTQIFKDEPNISL